MSGEYVLGPVVQRFEKSLSKALHYKEAVGCASGTEALVLALRAFDLAPQDEVITPAFSFVASTSAIAWAGLKPVFADVDIETACLTVESVKAVLTPKTRAIIAVDLYGRQAPIRELRRFCDQHALFLIEDGAQSIGVANQGAHFYTLSFYPTKNIGAVGDAGAVLTDNIDLAERVREISRHGGLFRDKYTRVGTTGRIDTLQAAVLEQKLPKLSGWTQLRRTLATWYFDHLQDLQNRGKLWLPPLPKDESSHVWALYTIRIPSGRDALAQALRTKGVGTAVYYPRTIPSQPAFQKNAKGQYPVSERLSREVLSLPIYPELTGREFETITTCLKGSTF